MLNEEQNGNFTKPLLPAGRFISRKLKRTKMIYCVPIIAAPAKIIEQVDKEYE